MSSFPQPLPSRLSVVAQRQGDSDEIGAFEATRYFSGGVDGEGLGLQGAMGEDRVSWVAGRKSLDTVLRAILPRQSKKGENQRKDDKKCRKLATFLNSFFNQTIYKKKSQSEKDRNLKEVQAGRRSSSISCSRTIRRSNEGYSNGRTNGHQKSVHFSSQREAWCHNRVTSEVWPAERAKSMDGYPENKCVINGNGDGLSKEEALGSEEFMGKQELDMRMEEGVTPALIYLN
ncbi:hypothetical protein B296_00037209 [Ensete ventricosum]|uniref:Uncharacterized protein n=1 Tax=Ensete ventricosum TaxID=4639 RepID=A0A426ZL86_ENSVE|nr:hypothetical protein B296_00037209 [Ensete ventricosum]